MAEPKKDGVRYDRKNIRNRRRQGRINCDFDQQMTEFKKEAEQKTEYKTKRKVREEKGSRKNLSSDWRNSREEEEQQEEYKKQKMVKTKNTDP
jgi:hypothetical protein